MIKPWTKLHSQIAGDYRVFKVREDVSRSPLNGQTHTFYVLEADNWINVVPLTPDGEVVLVKQYRHGAEDVMLEVPGGMVDPEDASPMQAARRELLEETGYDTEALFHIGTVHPNPAVLNNQCFTFFAENVQQIGPQNLDGVEDISLELVPLAKIPHLIAEGQISHALSITAFYFFDQYRRRVGPAIKP